MTKEMRLNALITKLQSKSATVSTVGIQKSDSAVNNRGTCCKTCIWVTNGPICDNGCIFVSGS